MIRSCYRGKRCCRLVALKVYTTAQNYKWKPRVQTVERFKVHSGKQTNPIWDFRGNYRGSFCEPRFAVKNAWAWPHLTSSCWYMASPRRTNSKHKTSAAQHPNCYLCCWLNLITGRPLGTGGSLRAQRCANNKILSEGIFSSANENGPSQCHIDDRILNLTLNQSFKKNEHCGPFIQTR